MYLLLYILVTESTKTVYLSQFTNVIRLSHSSQIYYIHIGIMSIKPLYVQDQAQSTVHWV